MKLTFWLMSLIVFAFGCIHAPIIEDDNNNNQGGSVDFTDTTQFSFPSFITPTSQYYEFSIGEPPYINGQQYHLKISGEVENPASFTLDELRKLDLVNKTVTIECIHNGAEGRLLSTAIWRGFVLYDLLESLGIKDDATRVKYKCADGYYTSNSLQEVKEKGIIGALYMNLDTIPRKYGYPLRILYPGYYGVRNPAWVDEIEVINDSIKDYWTSNGWNTSKPIAVDCKIFFPFDESILHAGKTISIGGVAYGGTRIKKVEITPDDGQSWIQASIVKDNDEDNVWVFWEARWDPEGNGNFILKARATDINGNVQPENDDFHQDGTNSWPEIQVTIK